MGEYAIAPMVHYVRRFCGGYARYWRMHKGSESLAEKKIPPLVNPTTKTAYKSEQVIELFYSILSLTILI